MGMTYEDAVHLLHRASFGGTPEEFTACIQLGRQESVRRLLSGISLTDKPEALVNFNLMTREGRPGGKRPLTASRIYDQQQYWLYLMVNTQAPLVEKMTLFWHGHFATAFYKVDDMLPMYQQNVLFRQYALGNFKELVQKIGKDPAMMFWLDMNRSKKEAPNENYSRELMELFTLGIGHYSEQDVKELARAFTGWRIINSQASFNANWYDPGVKTLLGTTGNLGYTEAVEIILKQQAYPIFLATKLLKFFATANPPSFWIELVANSIRTKNTIGEVLQELFNSNEFYKQRYRKRLFKSPTEYVVSTFRALGLTINEHNSYLPAKSMGQELYNPPDVSGWDGGDSWLNSDRMVGRHQFASMIARSMSDSKLNSSEFKPAQPSNPDDWLAMWCKRFGIGELSPSTKTSLRSYANDTVVNSSQPITGMRGLMQLVLMSPESQMK
ncbi:hypothetical protein GCM10008018_14000 [Paenibacillus marchantiophytorum]|uniref:DUF1800 domain-containing protein n=1 Tax=Paenibacillus marchantiophytorum TaxID=1619310 RepID=A0ABQ2BRE2_9BACL|nr:DUF1800 domain-containing protein [Paenibacillus marchantiophytorum]GGI45813.1 hypothetical protein GCM10008018_14000 [Paenibacillus marchantiophytorum]